METKVCSRCKVEKPIDEFYRHTSYPKGRNYTCKECDKTYNKGISTYSPSMVGTKTCTSCKKDKSVLEYHADRSSRDGRTWVCKDCYNNKKRSINYESDIDGNKQCCRCKEIKSVTEFYKNKRNIGGRSGKCKSCTDKITRKQLLFREYGLIEEEYEYMHKQQEGKCAICGKVSSGVMNIDHNHHTGKVRDLLCRKCNLLIGNAEEDINALQNAIYYLNKHKDPTDLVQKGLTELIVSGINTTR